MRFGQYILWQTFHDFPIHWANMGWLRQVFLTGYYSNFSSASCNFSQFTFAQVGLFLLFHVSLLYKFSFSYASLVAMSHGEGSGSMSVCLSQSCLSSLFSKLGNLEDADHFSCDLWLWICFCTEAQPVQKGYAADDPQYLRHISCLILRMTVSNRVAHTALFCLKHTQISLVLWFCNC